MLYLHQSNRLEVLAGIFAQLQSLLPLDDPFASEEVVVQSQGMRRYLNAYLARRLGVAANLKFSLPAGLAWRLMRDFIPGVPALSPFSADVVVWRLLDLFGSSRFKDDAQFEPVRAALSEYLGNGDAAAYQLAAQLADVFDQYLVYRPQWIDAWQQGKLVGLGEDEAWQAALWRFLGDGMQGVPHRVALWQQLLGSLSADKLPERFFVFGVAAMAPMYLQLLQAVAQHCDVHILALNPSSGYWGDVIDAAQILKNKGDIDLSQSGHPLLASLGKQGRDFFDALSEMPDVEERGYYDDVESGSLLRRLQYQIQTLQMPSENLTENGLEDGSIQVCSAHSPLRELQVLKTKLLRVLNEHPDWQPHDIAVLMPDIQPYMPYIEVVFGQEQDGAQKLPYSVSDVKVSRRQPLFYVLEQVFDLLQSRFEADKLLPLLDSHLVLARFNLSREDLPLLMDTVTQLNIHWGVDKAMRGSDALFTWQQGLDRLILGWMLPENGNGLWQGISAWHGDVNHLAVFEGFAEFIRVLSDTFKEWAQPAEVPVWIERIRKLIQGLTLPDADSQYAVQQLEQSLARWQEETVLAGFTGILSQETVIRHVEHFLGSESQAGFLRGGITFCSMVPMRNLPFKMICLLGLNDGDFPRNTKAAAFDLIAKYPQKGDRSRRDDDRYLFLEAIISAREILYLSYVGKNIENNNDKAPSALLAELIDTIAEMTGQEASVLSESWVENHYLQPFSRNYFSKEADNKATQRSIRQDYAEALNRPSGEIPAFFNPDSFPKPEPIEEQMNITQSEFLSFWRNPVKAWLRRTLGWSGMYTEQVWEAEEPFEPNCNAKIMARYIDARKNHADFTDVAEKLEAESFFPADKLGGLWQESFRLSALSLDAALVGSKKIPARAYRLQIGRFCLEGSLENVYENGQIIYLYQNLNAPQTIELMLEHLIFCAVRPSEIQTYATHIVQADCKVSDYPEIDKDQAEAILQKWLEYYVWGQARPLPFFAKLSIEAAKTKIKDEKKAREGIVFEYQNGQSGKAPCEYDEVKLVFGRDKILPVSTPLFWNMIDDLLVTLVKLIGL